MNPHNNPELRTILYIALSLCLLIGCDQRNSQPQYTKEQIRNMAFDYKPSGAKLRLYDVINNGFQYEYQNNNINNEVWTVEDISSGVYRIYFSFTRNSVPDKLEFTFDSRTRTVQGANKSACDYLQIQKPDYPIDSLGLSLSEFVYRWNQALSEVYPNDFSFLEINGKSLVQTVHPTSIGVYGFKYSFDENLYIIGYFYSDNSMRELLIQGFPANQDIIISMTEAWSILIEAASPFLSRKQAGAVLTKIISVVNQNNSKITSKSYTTQNITYTMTDLLEFGITLDIIHSSNRMENK